MSKSNAAPAAPQPDISSTENSDAYEANLRETDPDLANEIFGDVAEKANGSVITGQPLPAGTEPPAAPAAPEPAPIEPIAAAPIVEPEPVATPAAPSAPLMVPKARLDEVLARLEAMTSQQHAPAAPVEPAAPATPAEPAFNLAEKMREKLRAQWDGNEDRVIEIELEIEEYRQQVATDAAVSAVQRTNEAGAFNNAIVAAAQAVVADYPQLDNTRADYNAQAAAAFIAERDIQLNAGKSPAAAMSRAAMLIANDFGLTKASAPPPTPSTTTPAVVPAATPAGTVPGISARQVDVARIAAANANLPPNDVGGRGVGEIAPDTKAHTRDSWAQLSEAEKNRELGIE